VTIRVYMFSPPTSDELSLSHSSFMFHAILPRPCVMSDGHRDERETTPVNLSEEGCEHRITLRLHLARTRNPIVNKSSAVVVVPAATATDTHLGQEPLSSLSQLLPPRPGACRSHSLNRPLPFPLY
jgi:hypothetical protein